ncbi:amidase [uncultured Shimia sp.]|uniref:amidase n=1 Tax=uncultured Shimia sp. TaxID=573152 RepID=UPI0025DBA618|nr:amidase [uncultured Shimia sp.]
MNYVDFDAVGLAGLVRNGEVSPEELLTFAIDRTQKVNDLINAVVLVQEQTARKLIRNGLPEDALNGVPFLLKDLGAAAIDFPSHMGSRLTSNTKFKQNSTLYNRLASAGLVTFGRTTSPESGIGATTEAKVYAGPTRNPWNLEHSTGGSSGGAAAAVATGIVPAAHASDGGGSIRIPASCCGLFGFKPSRGLLPKGPNAGEGWGGMSTDGFISRSVRDSATLLDIVKGYEFGSPYSGPHMDTTFTQSLHTETKPLKIAICDTTFSGLSIHSECVKAVRNTATILEDLGHSVEYASPGADHFGLARAWMCIVSCGVALDLQKAQAERGEWATLENVEQVTLSAATYAKEVTGQQYVEALELIHKFGRDMATFFNKYDLLLTPTLAEPPALLGRLSHEGKEFEHYRLGDGMMSEYAPFTVCFNASGQPAASLPLHMSSDGLPIGVQLAARFGEDNTLMSVCRQLEEARPWFANFPTLDSTEAV